jgi:hypothetical protein
MTLNESTNIELVAFSEQIMNEDHEITPGIPTQDQALKMVAHRMYPQSTYVSL